MDNSTDNPEKVISSIKNFFKIIKIQYYDGFVDKLIGGLRGKHRFKIAKLLKEFDNYLIKENIIKGTTLYLVAKKKMKVLSIIPARGGSQSIKFKNLIQLGNKPLIYYSIKQSLNCKLIDRTIVSTDNKKIANISRKYGAEVPFLRPKKISKSNSKDFSFLKHALEFLKKKKIINQI